MRNENITSIDWSLLIKRIAFALALFTLSTFCIGLFIMQSGVSLSFAMGIMALSYLYVFFFSIKHVIEILPMPGIMIFTPLAPLIILIIVVSMIPLLEWLR